MLFYSYSIQWFAVEHRGSRPWRILFNGVVFGTLAVVLMIARIQVDDHAFIDARHVPIALIALFEGWPAGLVACALPAGYRLWQGGPGMWPGIVGLGVTALLGGAAHAWARRDGGVGPRHNFALAGGVFVTTAATYVIAGPHARELLRRYWLEMLLACVLGIGIIARIFQDVLEQARIGAERARFRAILDEATDAIRIVDADTLKILDCNRRDSEISGYTRGELIDRDARGFWTEALEVRERREATGAQDVVRTFGQPYRRRSGDVIRVDCTRRVVEHGGRRYEIVIYRESAEREARETSEREAAQLKAVTLLASAAAHEINNPLAIVMGSLDLLGRRVTSETQEARWVGQALVGVRRIRDIVLRMSHITRIEATPQEGNLPSILDIEKSTTVPDVVSSPAAPEREVS